MIVGSLKCRRHWYNNNTMAIVAHRGLYSESLLNSGIYLFACRYDNATSGKMDVYRKIGQQLLLVKDH